MEDGDCGANTPRAQNRAVKEPKNVPGNATTRNLNTKEMIVKEKLFKAEIASWKTVFTIFSFHFIPIKCIRVFELD